MATDDGMYQKEITTLTRERTALEAIISDAPRWLTMAKAADDGALKVELWGQIAKLLANLGTTVADLADTIEMMRKAKRPDEKTP